MTSSLRSYFDLDARTFDRRMFNGLCPHLEPAQRAAAKRGAVADLLARGFTDITPSLPDQWYERFLEEGPWMEGPLALLMWRGEIDDNVTTDDLPALRPTVVNMLN
jgi:hypothetical protein